MIKVKDGYAKLIGTTYQGSATQVLLSNGGDLEYSASSKASTLVQRNASLHIYATYFNSAISDEALTDIGSVYVRNTSDTFIRRVSKTLFYSILDNKFVTLDTAQTITGVKTFSTGPILANNATITLNLNSTSNYTTVVKWLKGGTSLGTYNPSIGQHNTGGDGNGSICILPYPTETCPWDGTVGLFISKGVLKLDGKSVALAENYYTKTESDERYVNVTGDTMTGPLIVKAAITGTQLISTIATGTSPLEVTSTTVVTNLNSDLLDGLHETSFFRARGDLSIASSVPTTTELATSNNLCGSWNVEYTGASGHLVLFNTGSGSTRYMQFYSMYSGSLYWRNSTDSTLNTKSWKEILDSSNYTAYINPANFVTALGTSGNYLTWTKNGVVNNLTVPYATASSRINSSSSVLNTGLTYYSSGGFVVGGTAAGGLWGMPSDSLDAVYENGLCLRMYWSSTYYTDILSGPNNMGTTHGLYMRLIVNGAVATGTFAGGWRLILDSYNYHRYGDTRYVTSLGTNGTYVTWVKNGTTNNLTVPYSSYSGYLQSHDTRSTNNTPALFSSGARFEFKYNSTDGLSNGGTYHGILHFKPYGGTTDFSGGLTHLLGFTDSGNLYMRTSTSSTAWGSWELILNLNTADGRYVTLTTNLTVSGIKTFSTLQKFTVATGTSPFTVTSTTVVTNLNSDLLDGRHSDGFMWFNTLSHMSDYCSYVIGLVRLSVIGRKAAGRIYLARTNILYNPVYIDYILGAAYSTSASPYTVSGTVICYGASYPVVTFEYNGEYYAGIKLYRGAALELPFVETSIRDIEPFIVNYYNNNTGGINNSEVNSSVSTTTRVSVSNRIYGIASSVAGTLTLSAGKFSSGSYNGSTSVTVNIPTNTSHLTNDSGFWTGTRYWANVAVSTASSTSTLPTFNTCYTSNWFRSTGNTGWYSESYGGGVYMNENYWVKTYGGTMMYIAPDAHAWGIGGHNIAMKLYHSSHIGINFATSAYTWGIYANSNGNMYIGRRTGNVNDGSGTYYHTLTTSYISSPGFYHSAIGSNSYVLLAGGSYKGLGDFAKGDAGSATKGVYVTGGTVTAMTYSLSSNLNSGTSGKLAYYSSATTVAAYTSSVGATNRGVYMNAGVPTVMTYYLNATVNSGTSSKLAYYSDANALSSYTSTVGSAYRPVYINAGAPTICSDYSFLGTSLLPVVLVSGYFYRSSSTSNSWYYTGYKHSQIGSPTFYVNGGVMRLTFSNSKQCSFISAAAQGRLSFSGSNTVDVQAYDGSNGNYDWRSEGSYWFNSVVINDSYTSYLYIRAYRLANSNNDSWYTGDTCWKLEEDAIQSVSFTIFGFIYP